jgi:hypothetical protein
MPLLPAVSIPSHPCNFERCGLVSRTYCIWVARLPSFYLVYPVFVMTNSAPFLSFVPSSCLSIPFRHLTNVLPLPASERSDPNSWLPLPGRASRFPPYYLLGVSGGFDLREWIVRRSMRPDCVLEVYGIAPQCSSRPFGEKPSARGTAPCFGICTRLYALPPWPDLLLSTGRLFHNNMT